MYAFDAKAAMFRKAWRLLPALVAILTSKDVEGSAPHSPDK
jgi:hypothetical protein